MQPTLKILLLAAVTLSCSWGFFAHQKINRLAVFTLPPEIIGFYKKNIDYLTKASTYPDQRRYAVADEAPRHFIDLDAYHDTTVSLPPRWKEAVELFGEDSLKQHGIVPWHVALMFARLKESFLLNDPEKILRNSAELGHYVADAHVPLHTTRNYNGQLTGQTGIHGFWESRLPELFFSEYDFFVGKATYLNDPVAAIWKAVHASNNAVDSVLAMERMLTLENSSKYSYETKGKQTVRVYAESFSVRYHERLSGMVERRFRASIKMIGDLWYTAWVDAGQPDVRQWMNRTPTAEELRRREADLEQWKEQNFRARDHENP